MRNSTSPTPSPLVGEGKGGGDGRTFAVVVPPTPNPSPHHAEGVSSTRRGGESARDNISDVILGLVPRIQRSPRAGAGGWMDGRDKPDHDTPLRARARVIPELCVSAISGTQGREACAETLILG